MSYQAKSRLREVQVTLAAARIALDCAHSGTLTSTGVRGFVVASVIRTRNRLIIGSNGTALTLR